MPGALNFTGRLVPQGQMCGEAPVLLSGGNMGVGCDGEWNGSIIDGFTYARQWDVCV